MMLGVLAGATGGELHDVTATDAPPASSSSNDCLHVSARIHVSDNAQAAFSF